LALTDPQVINTTRGLSAMPILTITTDWGLKDHHLAAFKGELYSHIPGIVVIDISNQISKFSIIEAAYKLRSTYSRFAEGTLHFIGLTGSEDAKAAFPYVIVRSDSHYFIGHDSGFFSLLLGEKSKEVHRLNIPANSKRSELQSQLVNSIERFLAGELQFTADEKLFELYTAQPAIGNNYISASVIYIDEFGNAVLNVDRATFENVCKNRSYTVSYHKADVDTSQISPTYDSVESGDMVVLFNQDDHLEIAINHGSAEQLLGIKLNDPVRIEFN
jgi:S-adenosyl-L-methionine hydrolase (adenosine-forming)